MPWAIFLSSHINNGLFILSYWINHVSLWPWPVTLWHRNEYGFLPATDGLRAMYQSSNKTHGLFLLELLIGQWFNVERHSDPDFWSNDLKIIWCHLLIRYNVHTRWYKPWHISSQVIRQGFYMKCHCYLDLWHMISNINLRSSIGHVPTKE
jgi:hypothetical protein